MLKVIFAVALFVGLCALTAYQMVETARVDTVAVLAGAR
jgi:hypothetical protein